MDTTAPVLELDHALRACAAGDRAALQSIYDLEAARMLGVALRLLRRRLRGGVWRVCSGIWRGARLRVECGMRIPRNEQRGDRESGEEVAWK